MIIKSDIPLYVNRLHECYGQSSSKEIIDVTRVLINFYYTKNTPLLALGAMMPPVELASLVDIMRI
jgi:hypothetical protein